MSCDINQEVRNVQTSISHQTRTIVTRLSSLHSRHYRRKCTDLWIHYEKVIMLFAYLLFSLLPFHKIHFIFEQRDDTENATKEEIRFYILIEWARWRGFLFFYIDWIINHAKTIVQNKTFSLLPLLGWLSFLTWEWCPWSLLGGPTLFRWTFIEEI